MPPPSGRGNYEELVSQERKRADEIEKQNKALTQDRQNAKKQVAELEETLAEARKTFETAMIEANKKAVVDLSGYLKTIDDLRNQVAKLGGEKDAVVKQADETQTRIKKEIDRVTKQNKETLAVLQARELDIEQLKRKNGVQMPKDWRTDWRVVGMDRFGKMVYLNLGSADHVQPQQTFSVHGRDVGGKPLEESKGSIEVVNILSDHMSQARVTSLKDANRDPILTGDLLYHPTWSPTLKKHVAIAGIIDLTGDGRDSLPEFLRNLERQNVVVDAYLDLRNLTVKGRGININTQYLILGDGPEVFSDRTEKTNKDFVEKLSKGMGDLQEQATKFGVPTIGLRRYLEQIGYRLPRGPGRPRRLALYAAHARCRLQCRRGRQARRPQGRQQAQGRQARRRGQAERGQAQG